MNVKESHKGALLSFACVCAGWVHFPAYSNTLPKDASGLTAGPAQLLLPKCQRVPDLLVLERNYFCPDEVINNSSVVGTRAVDPRISSVHMLRPP